ncbi:MAG: hypothetical protein ACREDD_08215 [Methylocella sp.]
MVAKESTVHRKRLQAPTIATMDLAMGSRAIGFSNAGSAGVSVDFAMLCYRQSEKQPAKVPLTQKHGCAVNPKTRENRSGAYSLSMVAFNPWLAVLNP